MSLDGCDECPLVCERAATYFGVRTRWSEAAFRRQTPPTYDRSGSLLACSRRKLLLVENQAVFYESWYLWGKGSLIEMAFCRVF